MAPGRLPENKFYRGIGQINRAAHATEIKLTDVTKQ
jgi:hypothetical protein